MATPRLSRSGLGAGDHLTLRVNADDASWGNAVGEVEVAGAGPAAHVEELFSSLQVAK